MSACSHRSLTFLSWGTPPIPLINALCKPMSLHHPTSLLSVFVCRDGIKARPQTLHMALRVAMRAKHTLAITNLQTQLTFAQDMPLPEYRSRLAPDEGTSMAQLAARIQAAGDLNKDRYGYLQAPSQVSISRGSGQASISA